MESKVTWHEYISSEPGGHPTLGREILYKETTKAFRATLAMVSIFKMKNETIYCSHINAFQLKNDSTKPVRLLDSYFITLSIDCITYFLLHWILHSNKFVDKNFREFKITPLIS